MILPPGGAIGRYARALLERRLLAGAAVAGLSVLSIALAAARVRPDFSVDHVVPAWDPARQAYDRFKHDFPYADARAVVIVEAPDVFTPEGLARVAAIERDLGAIAGVVETESIASVRDAVAAGPDEVRLERLFPRPDLPPAELARRRATATTDPVFAWRLAPPDGRAATIRFTLGSETDPALDTRARFVERMRILREARGAVARHERPAQTLTLGGFPVTRAEYAEMIARDAVRLFPVALAVVLALLWLTFGAVRDVAAALATVAVAIVWTLGALAVVPYREAGAWRFGAPLQLLTQLVPVIVMIISISDTVHIIARFKALLAAGLERRDALVEALEDAALPCLLTEVVIACGFLSLAAINVVAILQFGVVLAAGMLLTWLANVTALPLILDLLRPAAARPEPAPTRLARAFARFTARVERAVTAHPRGVAVGAAAILAVAALAATRARKDYRVYDDLRPESPLARRLERVTDLYGGVVPLAIHIEPAEGAPRDEPMLEPDAIALADRLARDLRAAFPEVRLVASPADFVRKTHRLLVGEEEAARAPLPATRALVAQEIAVFEDGRTLRDVLTFDRRAAAVQALVPDVGAARAREIAAEIERRLEAERGGRWRVTLTGVFAMADDVHATLVDGLVTSFAVAVAVSFAAFCAVLRSWRLGLLALVPNLIPVVITLGFMGAAGIAIKPSTVIAFSITLTIADDDTIQFLARFRRAYAAARAGDAASPHAEAALATLRETGLPMFVTASAVAAGFASLVFSSFVGLANLGLLVGVSLFAAVFGDLFLTPLLLMKIRPRMD